MKIEVGGAGSIAYAGVVLPRLLADRLGLTGDLAAMLRPGSAGSSTAVDHIAVLDAAFAQLPPQYRTNVLVTVDGAGSSTAVDHLTGLNTAAKHGKRGRGWSTRSAGTS